MINAFFYYVFFASAVLSYGIGIHHTIVSRTLSYKRLAVLVTKLFFSIEGTTVLSWLLIEQVLLPLNLAEFYPLIALMLFIAASAFMEIIIRITIRWRMAEYAVPYAIVLLVLGESGCMADAALFPVYCLAAFVFVLLVLRAMTARTAGTGFYRNAAQKRSRALVSVAIIAIAMLVFDVTWLNPGVLP